MRVGEFEGSDVFWQTGNLICNVLLKIDTNYSTL